MGQNINPPGNLASVSTAPPVVLTWSRGLTAASYNVYRDRSRIANVVAPTVTYSDAGVSLNSRHRYFVTAVDAGGNESTGTPPLDVTIEPTGTLTFQLVYTPTAGHLGTPDLQWRWG